MTGIKQWLKLLYAYGRCDRKAIAYQRYIDAGGESLRLDYPLSEDALVIDVGGYVGDFSAEIIKKFDCCVFDEVHNYGTRRLLPFLQHPFKYKLGLSATVEKMYNEQTAIKAFSGYDTADWFDFKGNPILNWKQKMINVWFKDENKIPEAIKTSTNWKF